MFQYRRCRENEGGDYDSVEKKEETQEYCDCGGV